VNVTLQLRAVSDPANRAFFWREKRLQHLRRAVTSDVVWADAVGTVAAELGGDHPMLARVP
jgi:hypothetical protein